MVPAFDGGDDFVWIGGPDEWLWRLIGFGDEAVDGGLKLRHGTEDAAFQPPLGQLGEIALDGIEPGTGCRREVEDEARMAFQPCQDLGMLVVGGIIVEHDVDHVSGRYFGFNLIEETNELLMAVALHATADHLALHTLRAANSVLVP